VAQSKILLDSNSYFRLAKSLHPLLFQEFGNEKYCLYVLKELQEEYDRQPRLQAKFPWVDDPEIHANRSKSITLSKKQKNQIPCVCDHIWDYVLTVLPGPSRVDVTILSHAYVLGIPVVTDDGDMRALADIFEIPTFKTLGLLKLMLEANHIGIEKVRQIAAFWSYEDDRPADYARDFKRLFGESAPP